MIGDTRSEILLTVFACINYDKRHYTRPRRHKILSLLNEFHHKVIGIRWQSYCIKYLVDHGYINRRARYVHDEGGLIRQIPSMFSLTYKGLSYLTNNLVKGARELRDKMREQKPKHDRRWPTADFEDLDKYRKLHAEEIKRLKRLPAL